MRTIAIALLLTATAFCATERAKYAEIKLASGEVLKEVAVMSQTPTHITVLVASKMRQVAKKDLPPELQKVYPVDEAADAQRKQVAAELEEKRSRLAKERSAENDKKRLKDGVRIVSSTATGYPGVLLLTIKNETSSPHYVFASDIVGRLSDGTVKSSQFLNEHNAPFSGSFSLDGNSSRPLSVYFFAGSVGSVDDVYWRQK